MSFKIKSVLTSGNPINLFPSSSYPLKIPYTSECIKSHEKLYKEGSKGLPWRHSGGRHKFGP